MLLVKRAKVENPVEIIPSKEDVPAPPALFAKKLDVLLVKRPSVENPDEIIPSKEEVPAPPALFTK